MEQAGEENIEEAIQSCKQQSDPFAFLRDAQGNYLSNGGEIDILGDALERIFVNPEEKEQILQRLPSQKISAGGIQKTEAEFSIEDVLAEKREEYFIDLIDVYARFAADPESISKEDLEVISVPGIPMTV